MSSMATTRPGRRFDTGPGRPTRSDEARHGPALHLRNVRDLGGLPTARGGLTRHGVALRSDDIAQLPPAFAWALHERQGIRDIIDLRSHTELARVGRGTTYELPVRYHHLPTELLPRRRADDGLPLLPATAAQLGVWYADAAERCALPLRFALEVVADADGPVLFHGVAGRDRTGLLAALLLSAAGVARHAIVADYARTATSLPRPRSAVPGPDAGGAGATGVTVTTTLPDDLLDAAPETMERCLEVLESRHGCVLTPLRGVGLTARKEARLRRRLVDGR